MVALLATNELQLYYSPYKYVVTGSRYTTVSSRPMLSTSRQRNFYCPSKELRRLPPEISPFSEYRSSGSGRRDAAHI